MAKRRKKGYTMTVPRDIDFNTVRGRGTLPADPTAGDFTEINTNLAAGQLSTMAWDIYWCEIQPEHYDDLVGLVTAGGMEFQLAVGVQAAVLMPDDSKVLCNGGWTNLINTSGMTNFVWPWRARIHRKVTCLSSKMTLSLAASNVAGFQSMPFYYELGYLIRPQRPNELQEYLAARGEI
jgi:hypothetical protein